jgi:hypothetical protein
MNIISCEKCGVMIDTNRIHKLEWYEEEDEKNFKWKIEEGDFLQVFECPCCKIQIFILDGEVAN